MNTNRVQFKQPRRPKGYLSPYSTNTLHVRNAYASMWWSACMPGSAHILLGKHLKGFLLFVWEFVINMTAGINQAIELSMTGQFHAAVACLHYRWFLLYAAVYLFVIWDSYRLTTELNQFANIADRTGNVLQPFGIDSFEVNYLNTTNPWTCVIWSLLTPGLGQLIVRLVPTGIYLIVWFIIVAYQSHFCMAVEHTLLGRFGEATRVLNAQWALSLPSIYTFAVYHGFTRAKEINALFKTEQSRFLANEYQSTHFSLDDFELGDSHMHIISAFPHSLRLESAIAELEQNGIRKEEIFAVPLGRKSRLPFPSPYNPDGMNLLGAASIATVGMLLGMIYGYVLSWGPIIWGLIGIIVGGGVGLIVDLTIFLRREKNRERSSLDVVLQVRCPEAKAEIVESILWNHQATGVSRIGTVS